MSMDILTLDLLAVAAKSRELSSFEKHRAAVLNHVVAELRHYADLTNEDARAARESGDAEASAHLFEKSAALDRAADILVWG